MRKTPRTPCGRYSTLSQAKRHAPAAFVVTLRNINNAEQPQTTVHLCALCLHHAKGAGRVVEYERIPGT